ncbi:glutathione S-transferase [Sphingomonas sp. DBB INV C78]|uniref:glutathione S-transferase family protein n=1 Tax=Sphingomonas sp. DBB INV C78 TaxID=3349434 RepID=UPI0036D32141
MLTLHYHPFSSYCQKVLIALYERDLAFTPNLVDFGNPDHAAALEALWPMMHFPVVTDDATGRTIPESSIIIEYCDQHFPGAAPLIPADRDAALEVRLMDRVFDDFIQTPMQRLVNERMRPDDEKDARNDAEARALLSKTYHLLEERLAGRTWAAGDAFTLADCAAAPGLFYANWVHPFRGQYPVLTAYFDRLLARPSFARAVEEARPYRSFFPGGAPEA